MSRLDQSRLTDDNSVMDNKWKKEASRLENSKQVHKNRGNITTGTHAHWATAVHSISRYIYIDPVVDYGNKGQVKLL